MHDKKAIEIQITAPACSKQAIATLYQPVFSSDDTLLNLKEVLQWVKYSKQGLYKLMNQNLFPRPVHLGQRRVAWVKAEVLNWINQSLVERNERLSPKNAQKEVEGSAMNTS